MSEQEIPSHPFDSAFKTLVATCPQLLRPVINDIFHTSFTDRDRVVLMDSKLMKPLAMGKILTREVDSLFAIGDDLRQMFHVELQSEPDGTMVARFWEYDSGVAMKTAEITKDGVMLVRFPRSAVLYLRHTANTPDLLKVKFERNDGETVDLYDIPVTKVQRYDLDELISKELLFLFPYYPFRYERMLAEYDADESKSAPLRDDLARMLKHLDHERDDGRIDGMTLRAVRVATMSVLRGLAYKHTNVMKGVETMLEGTILQDVAFAIHDKAWDEGEAVGMQKGEQKGRLEGRQEGRQEGRAEGILSTLIGLVRDGILGISDAAKRSGLSRKAFKAKMAEYEARPSA